MFKSIVNKITKLTNDEGNLFNSFESFLSDEYPEYAETFGVTGSKAGDQVKHICFLAKGFRERILLEDKERRARIVHIL